MEYTSINNLKSKSEPMTYIPHDVMAEIEDKINWCIQTMKDKGFPLEKLPRIHIRANLKGATAGRAKRKRFLGDAYLSFHPGLLAKYKDDYIRETVPHEVAHIIAGHLKPGCGSHRSTWRGVMYTLGLEPIRCHAYDVTEFQTHRPRPFVYKCACSEHQLTSILHSRIQNGRWRRCKRCRQKIAFDRVA